MQRVECSLVPLPSRLRCPDRCAPVYRSASCECMIMTRRTSLSAGSATSRRQTRTSSSCDVIGTDCCVLIVLMSLCHKQSCVSVSGVAAFVSKFLKWSNHLLLLHPFPLSCWVNISYRLHLTRFCTSSHDNSLSDKSFLMLSNHLCFGLPLLLFPGTSIMISIIINVILYDFN